MPFTRSQFLGLSLVSANATIGWGRGSVSTLNLTLVQDILNGDVPLSPLMGQPAYFSYYNFTFGGLLQKYEKKTDFGGNPIYEAILVDPREILEGTEIIVNDYNGSTLAIPNLINAFGYWENIAYGASLANDSGMPWLQIMGALNVLCSQPLQTAQGGPLNYRGIAYSLDLSAIPIPPASYRIGGTNISLLDAIAQVCEDGGVDFHVELQGYTIVVRTVSRQAQPPLGTIAELMTLNQGNIVRAADGLEARNEVTSSFLVGGYQTAVNITSNIQSFWGYDLNGNPIIGIPGNWVFKNTKGKVLKTVPTEYALLNAGGIADIIGQTVYTCSTLEMRLALESYDSWSAFIQGQRSDIAKNIYSTFAPVGVDGALNGKPDLINNDPATIKQLNRNLRLNVIGEDFFARQQRLYDFVRSYATDFYGKKFVVSIPFLLAKDDPETLIVTASQEPTDGGYMADGTNPLGVPELFQDTFTLQDGRWGPLVVFDNVLKADLSQVAPGDTALGGPNNQTLWTRVQLDTKIVLTPAPAALITLGSPVYYEQFDAVGDASIIAGIMNGTGVPQIDNAVVQGQNGNITVKIHAAAIYPSVAAVPLISNISTYGPWYTQGAPGKVKFDIDATLVPWNYGGFANLNIAANSRVVNTLTDMQVAEAGTLELAGIPLCSLGRTLYQGGPNVTNLSFRFGKDGLTTSYQFATFTPRPFVYNKNLDKRLQRMQETAQSVRRNVRSILKQQLATQAIRDAAQRGAVANRAPKAVKKESPYDVLVGGAFVDPSGNTRIGVSAVDVDEALGLLGADDDNLYQTKAVASLSTIARPFAVNPAATGVMATFTAISGAFAAPTILNAQTLSPFPSGHDIEFQTWGTTFSGLGSFRYSPDPTTTRSFALRGPQTLTGWGYDLNANPVPALSGNFYPNYLRRSDLWPTGPVDHLWDAHRGVWTSHDLLYGQLQGDLAASGTATLVVYQGTTATPQTITVHNYENALVPSGTAVKVGYLPTSNTWDVFAPAGVVATTATSLRVGTPDVSGVQYIDFASGDAFTVNALGSSGVLVNLLDFARTRHGLVPAPGGSGSSRVLWEDGSWRAPPSGITVDGSGVGALVFPTTDAYAISYSGQSVQINLTDFLSGTSHKHGLVPDPGPSGSTNLYLAQSGWQAIPIAPPASSLTVNTLPNIFQLNFPTTDAFSVTQPVGGAATVNLLDFGAGSAHKHGLVPDPGNPGSVTLFLSQLGWQTPLYPSLTVEASGGATNIVPSSIILDFQLGDGFTVGGTTGQADIGLQNASRTQKGAVSTGSQVLGSGLKAVGSFLHKLNPGDNTLTGVLTQNVSNVLQMTTDSGSNTSLLVNDFIQAGGSGMGTGTLALGQNGSADRLLLQTSPPLSGDLTLVLPGVLPTSGQLLQVATIAGRSVTLNYVSGFTGSGTAVTAVSCSGTTLVVTTVNENWSNGLLLTRA